MRDSCLLFNRSDKIIFIGFYTYKLSKPSMKMVSKFIRIWYQQLIISAILISSVKLDWLYSKNIKQIRFNKHLNPESIIPEPYQENFGSVIKIDFSNRKIEQLPEVILLQLTNNLREFLLNGNRFQNLSGEIFKPLENLKTLNISDNLLTFLDEEIFQHLPTLETLDLSSNKLDNLAKSTFRSLTELKILRLSNNGMTILNDGIFDTMKNLIVLHLDGNELTRISGTLFVNNLNLIEINLNNAFKGNFILPSEIFKKQLFLKNLHLEWNNLTSLPQEIFKFVRKNNLETLELGNNQLSELHGDLFERLNKLKILKINNNQLTRVPRNLFYGLEDLTELNLSHNRLIINASGDSLHLLRSAKLTTLDLSHNFLTKVYEECRWLNNLQNLDLSYNKLDNLTTEDFVFRNVIPATIKYCNNNITSINLTGIEEREDTLKETLSIYVENNPIICDYRALTLQKHLQNNASKVKINADHVRCNAPDSLKNELLKEVGEEELKCSTCEKEFCPEKCKCNYRLNEVIEVNCTSVDMKTFPKKIPRTVHGVELLFDGNDLVSIDGLQNISENDRNRVVVLSLSNNKLQKIDGIELLKGLKTLKLDNNRLTFLDNQTINQITSLENLTTITLHQNPWEFNFCTTTLLKFIRDNYNKTHQNNYDILCANNNTIVTPEKKDRHQIQPAILIYIGIAIIALMAILCSLGLILYCMYEREIKIWMFEHKVLRCLITETDKHKDKEYDAFVSFCHKNQKFINKHLIPELEQNNEKNYKLCIYSRDFYSGERIAQLVENSKQSIIVLTPDFLRCVGCRKLGLFNKALSKSNKVVVIMLQDVRNEIPSDHELNTHIKSNSCLKWGDKLFWRKLKYALGYPTANLRVRYKRNESMPEIRVESPSSMRNGGK